MSWFVFALLFLLVGGDEKTRYQVEIDSSANMLSSLEENAPKTYTDSEVNQHRVQLTQKESTNTKVKKKKSSCPSIYSC